MLEFLKKNPVTFAMGHFVKERYRDLICLKNFRQERTIARPDGPVRVGFLCQYIPAWQKVAPIYEKMREDPRFDPCLICVPSEQVMAKESFATTPENDTYDYFVSRGYDAINALTGANSWLDLQTLGLSYIFYPRPYNHLLPAPYHTRQVSRYCRICIVMYGISFAQEDMHTSLNRDFMSYVYYYFAETPFTRDENRKINRLLHKMGWQKSVFLGLPVLEALHGKKDAPSPAWDFSRNQFRVIWTPRWTTDKALGGSNFFTYYQDLLTFAGENPDIDFLHRPHPLALTHFQQTGELTAEQAEAYVESCRTLPNVEMDKLPEYETTLWGSSVLVSDISGIMVEYFSTGKPIIFCATNMELALTPYFARMLEGCYVVHSNRELFDTLSMLKNGQDPLAETRGALIREILGDLQGSPSTRIVEALAEDSLRK